MESARIPRANGILANLATRKLRFDKALGVLFILVAILDGAGQISGPIFWTTVFGPLWVKMLALASGFILSVYAGGVVIGILVEPLVKELRSSGDEYAISRRQRGFEKGGRYIGQLERTLILLFVLVNQPTGVGFLVAAKSVFRFGDLKEHEDRMEAEYIIIGTMLSFAWGLVAAWLTQYVLQNICKDQQDSQPQEVPVVPIYIQEKIHPQAIIEDFRATSGTAPKKPRDAQLSLFSDFNGLPDDVDKRVAFYHHEGNRSNRLIHGNS